MNVLDTQLVRSQLQALGYRFTDDWTAADVVLYNTCSVREHAESKVYSRIGQVGQRKKERPDLILGVLGCMAERDGQNMIRRYPQIDVLVGPGELDQVPMLIDNIHKTSTKQRGGLRNAQVALQGNTHRRSGTLSAAQDQLEMLDLSRSFSPDEHHGSAYVRITRGCNKFCTYCVVPNTRGAEVHRPPENIVEECRKLVESGVVEITLLGQTVNHYHYDHDAAVMVDGVLQPQVGAPVGRDGLGVRKQSRRITSFANLLAMLHDQLPGLQRLRFVTNFPRDFGDDILQVMADRPRICKYIHLPVQSGSDTVLARMNRGYIIAEYKALLARIREKLPTAELCTDIICGFPGESDDDHRATLELLRLGRYKNAFIFKYSPRPGTAAYDRLPDDVPETVKKRRNQELLALQTQISLEVHQAYVGKSVPVFVESISDHALQQRDAAAPDSGSRVTLGWEKPVTVTQLTGRTQGDIIVCFAGKPEQVGRIVDVQIERAAPLALFGKVVTEQPHA